MPRKPPVRRRPVPVRVMLSLEEKDMLEKAADEVGVATSAFIRVLALEGARRREREEKAA